jgi:hypothetical protein
MIDLALIAIIAGVTWTVQNEGAWTAGTTFLCVVIAGLLAMNFFEPATLLLVNVYRDWNDRWDMIALLGLFIGGVFALRAGAEYLAPTYVQLPALVDQIGRWLFGAATGYVTMAIILTALHTAPIPREFLGFTPERANLFNMAAPDRQWLGFVQYVTEKPFGRFDLGPQVGAQPDTPHGFDSAFLLVGDPNAPYANSHWPSYPIRYAMRRDQLYGIGNATPAAAIAPPRPTPGPVPVTPGGGGSVGF